MTIQVLSSADLVQHVLTGETPVPAEVAADNAAQAAKKEGKAAEAAPAKAEKSADWADKAQAALKAAVPADSDEAKTADADDIEGEDGITARQKRDLSTSMLSQLAKKHRKLKEAEEFAADRYNTSRLAEQRADMLERENMRLKSQMVVEKPAPVVTDPTPKRENFATEDAFQDAMIDYRVDQKFRVKEAEAAQQRENDHMAGILEIAKARVEKAKILVPDFMEVIGAADLAVPDVIAGFMQESELVAELGYHFAKHPDILKRLAGMKPAAALVDIGKIISTLQPFSSAKSNKADEKSENADKASAKNDDKSSNETVIPPSKPRAAAPVITPLNAGSSTQVDKPFAEMTTQEAIQDYQRKKRANFGVRKRH